MHYLEVLQQLHGLLQPRIYAEIGVFTGASLALSRTRSVGIDPGFSLAGQVLADKPWVKLFRMESDVFFARHQREHVLDGGALDLAFLDGLHLFENVLRDFYHLESWSSPDGVIAIHDVLPRDASWAQRDTITPEWTGDVWRIVPCLEKFRPDLKLRLLDAPPSGLLLVSRLDPASTVLNDHEVAICEEYLVGNPLPYAAQVADYLQGAAVLSADEWMREVRAALVR